MEKSRGIYKRRWPTVNMRITKNTVFEIINTEKWKEMFQF